MAAVGPTIAAVQSAGGGKGGGKGGKLGAFSSRVGASVAAASAPAPSEPESEATIVAMVTEVGGDASEFAKQQWEAFAAATNVGGLGLEPAVVESLRANLVASGRSAVDKAVRTASGRWRAKPYVSD